MCRFCVRALFVISINIQSTINALTIIYLIRFVLIIMRFSVANQSHGPTVRRVCMCGCGDVCVECVRGECGVSVVLQQCSVVGFSTDRD